MKTRSIRSAVAAGMLAMFVAAASAQSWQEQGYHAQAEKISAKVKAGQLNVHEANQQMLAVTKSYFPNDPLLTGVWEDLTELAKSHVEGRLTAERFDELVSMRWEIFSDANRARHQVLAQQQAAQQAAEDEQRRGTFMQNFLASMARSMERNNPAAIQCNSVTLGGQASTTCR